MSKRTEKPADPAIVAQIDRTLAKGVAPDRAALVRLALREYGAARQAQKKAPS